MQVQHWQDIIFPALATLLTALAGLVARAAGQYLAAKTHAVSAESSSALLEQIADNAIHYAEQWAANKTRIGDSAAAPEKMDAALDHAVAAANRLGLVDAGVETLRAAIEARLGKLQNPITPSTAPAAPAVAAPVVSADVTVRP